MNYLSIGWSGSEGSLLPLAFRVVLAFCGSSPSSTWDMSCISRWTASKTAIVSKAIPVAHAFSSPSVTLPEDSNLSFPHCVFSTYPPREELQSRVVLEGVAAIRGMTKWCFRRKTESRQNNVFLAFSPIDESKCHKLFYLLLFTHTHRKHPIFR